MTGESCFDQAGGLVAVEPLISAITPGEAPMGAIWQFVIDNRDTLSWLGGGVVVVAGGLWTVTQFFLKREKSNSVTAVGGIAAGGDIRNRNSPITISNTGTISNTSNPRRNPET